MQVATRAAAPQVFQFHTAQVRTVTIDGEPWFIAADVCAALTLADTNKALLGLDDDEKLTRTLFASGQNRELLIINESGLYSLVLRSRKPQAKAFRRWVTNEVLPAIRKTGRYALHRNAAPQAGIAPEDLALLHKTIRQIAEVVVPERVARFTQDTEARIFLDCGIRSWGEADSSVLLYARDFVNGLRNKSIQMKEDQCALQSRYWLWFFQPGRRSLPDGRDSPFVTIDPESWFPRPL